jgi:prepilin signal peptidase PulO-like enzyme (type II secretory pathway)
VVGLLPVIYGLLAGILAGGVGAILLLATRRMERRSFMPYGPYLCFGGWLAMLPRVLEFWGIR